MNTTLDSNTTRTSRRSGGLVAGSILILIGVLSLSQFIPGLDLDFFFLPAMGLIFLAAGLLSRTPGLLVPGGILMGVGAGALLVDGQGFLPMLGALDRGGVFMLSMAGGFALISATSLLIGKRMFWALIPAFFMALVGAALLIGETGLMALQVLGYAWPVVLIALGAALILRRKE
jgi:hypothetical protein